MSTKPKNLVYTIRFNKPQSIRLAAYGTLLLFIGGGLFQSLILHSNKIHTNFVIAVFTFIVTILIHELIHGVFFKFFGGEPKYGVGLSNYIFPYAYATCPGQSFTLMQMTAVALSPLIIICSFAIFVAVLAPSIATYCLIAFASNFSGAIGDIWLLNKIYKFRKIDNLVIVDLRDGMGIYGSGSRVKDIVRKEKAKDNPKVLNSGFMSIWLTASAIIFFINATVPIIFTMVNFHINLVIGPSDFPLLQYKNSNSGAEYVINPLSSIAAGFVFTLLLKILVPGKQAKAKTARSLS